MFKFFQKLSCTKTSFIFFVLLSLVGCSIGPKYIPPNVSVPSSWSNGNTHKPSVKNAEAWWRNFQDPLLNELIEQDAVYNLDLKMARTRVKTARAEYAVASAQLFPSASLAALPPAGTGVTINQLIALSVALEPDIFGKIRQTKHRARANLNITEAKRDFALINLYAEIASSYLELRAVQAKNSVLHKDIAGYRQVLQFIKSRYKAGYANYMNIAQQNGLIEGQLAELEQNKALITALIHKLELLTGNNPGVLEKKLLPPKPVPQIAQNINLGIPSELLRRRPDIIAAEQGVAAAHANIRIAMASLLPQITIGWLLGWQTQTLASNLFAIQNPDSTLFGTITAPLFNLSLYRTIDVRKREKIHAVIQYQIAILRALHEVEAQYSLCQHNKNSADHLKRAVAQKSLALQLAKDTYLKGSSDFNSVLIAEEEVSHIKFLYLQSIVKLQVAKINLYKALGGNVIVPKVRSMVQNQNIRKRT